MLADGGRLRGEREWKEEEAGREKGSRSIGSEIEEGQYKRREWRWKGCPCKGGGRAVGLGLYTHMYVHRHMIGNSYRYIHKSCTGLCARGHIHVYTQHI